MFLVGDYRINGTINDLFRDGFNIIADRIGADNAIIQQAEKSHIEWEIIKALHQKMEEETELANYLSQFESRIPGLMIFWKHPTELTKEDAIIHIPFQAIENVYSSSNDVLIDLIDFAKKNNSNFIDKLKKKNDVIRGLSFSVNLGIFAINFEL